MSFKGIGFYEFASDLFSSSKEEEEAKLRTVISRAYYGAFLACRDKAGITTTGPNVHQLTAEHYSVKVSSAMGNRLDDLRSRRNDADYDTKSAYGRKKAGEALVYAKKLLDDLEKK